MRIIHFGKNYVLVCYKISGGGIIDSARRLSVTESEIVRD
jgi:hypothetical protein